MMKYWLNILILCLSTLLLTGNYIFAQESQRNGTKPDTIALEDVTISVLPFREGYMEAAGGVYLLPSNEIRKFSSFPSADLINLAPGVHMASGSLNTNRIVIRGIGSRTPYSSNRIRAYLDDIPLTSGDGISTLEDLDQSSIGSLEILKGPASALYGSGLGGVIRLNSVYPEHDGFQASLLAEYGSYNRQRYGLTSSYKKGKLAINGGITRSSTDGFRENSAFNRTSAFLNARFFGDKHTASLTLSLVDLYAEIPSSLNEDDFLQEPWKAGGTWAINKGFEEYVKLLSGISIASKLSNKLDNKITLFSSYNDPYERRPFNILDERSSILGLREILSYKGEGIKLSAGFEYFSEWFQWSIFETEPETRGALLSDQQETRKYLNGFVLAQWRPVERILIDAGLNLNVLNYSLTSIYHVDSMDLSGSYSYSPVFSPRLGMSYKHSRNIWSFVSAGHGFSAPSLEETLLPEGTVNTALRPESGWNLEAGNRGSIIRNRLNYDVSLYTIFLNDLLVTERLSEDIFTGINAGNVQNTGMEFLLRGSIYPEREKPLFNASMTLGYTLSKNVFRDFEDDGVNYKGNHLPGVPEQELNTILEAGYKAFHIRIQHSYTGEQWMNDANTLKYNSYHLTHLQLKWKLDFRSPGVSLTFRGGIRNLFNTEYASMILINAPSFGGNAPRYYYPGAPRHFHLGLAIGVN